MPASTSAIERSASRRRSVLKMLNSVSSAMNALPVSGAVSASVVAAGRRIPSAGLSRFSAASSAWRSDVKSWSTVSDVVERDDRDDVGRRASSSRSRARTATARATSSGCIEPRSKKSTIRRRVLHVGRRSAPRRAARRRGSPPGGRRGLAHRAEHASASPSTAATRSRFPRSRSSCTVCGLPSSCTTKSSRVRPRTSLPSLSRTTTLTTTRSRPGPEGGPRGLLRGRLGGAACGADRRRRRRGEDGQ